MEDKKMGSGAATEERLSGHELERIEGRRVGRKGVLYFAAQFLSYIALVVIAIIMAGPLVWMALSAFKPLHEVVAIPPTFLPDEFTLQNFINMPNVFPIAIFYRNSLIIAIATTAAVLFTSSLSGYVLAKFEFPGREVIFISILSTLMVPQIVTLPPLYLLIDNLGWVNTYWGLMVPGLFSSYGIFLMRQFVATIPTELMYAARIDGCSEFGIYTRIILPLSKPALSALGIFAFLGNWDSFLWPLIVINSKEMRTVPIGLAYYAGEYIDDFAGIMAGSLVAVIPVLIVYFIFQRQLIKGITLSGLTGI